MANKILKTLTLPNAQGEPVTYELHPEWDNIENKPDFSELGGGVGQEYLEGSIKKGEIFNDYTSNVASGEKSHAEGSGTTASGSYSHTEGYNTVAAGQVQHVQGRCNIEDTTDTYAHIVGNGDDENNRSNAHTLDWHGNAWYAGSITATKLILGPESYGTSLPETGVEGQIFFLLGGSSGTATDDGNGVITLG